MERSRRSRSRLDREKEMELMRERERELELRESRRFREMKEAVEPEADPERDQRTVFAYQMPLKATERDVYEFFSQAGKEEEIERELANVTFEELLRARSDGSEMVYRKPNEEKKCSRANKNRPMEMSSKKPVSRFREVVQVPKTVARDPRFESLCGELNVEGFKKRYDFIHKNELPAEKEALRKKMKEEKDPEVINELKDRVARIDRELKSAVTKHTDREIIAEHKKKEREAAKKGKRPYYLKKSDIRKQKLIQKYEELKGSGKLESFLDKKRRKNAAKDHRYMPYRRPAEQ